MTTKAIEIRDTLPEIKNVQEARELIPKVKPDVVILDILMPDGNGINVMEHMQKEGVPSKVIIFTNYPYLHYRKKYLDAGADYFFYKAIEFQKLIYVLKRLIPRYQKTEEP